MRRLWRLWWLRRLRLAPSGATAALLWNSMHIYFRPSRPELPDSRRRPRSAPSVVSPVCFSPADLSTVYPHFPALFFDFQ